MKQTEAEKIKPARTEKNKRKWALHTLRGQIAALFMGFLLLSMLVITAINVLFLEHYYISRKTDTILEAIQNLDALDFSDDAGENEETIFSAGENDCVPDEVRKASLGDNLSWIIITKDNQVLAQVGDNSILLQNRLFGYAYNLDHIETNSTTLEKTDTYIVQKIYDRFSGMDYVESWGTLTSGNFFLIRTPLESIKESVAISNSFYFFVGLLIIILSGIVVWFATKKFMQPISQLTELSIKMSDLDFDAKYTSKSGNEIDVLGESFNKMSKQLETTICELKSANNELQKDIEDKIKIDKMRKEFLDNVSHELKTPIALVQGYAEGLKENITEDPESMEFYCDVIMDEAAKMNKLVKNLLTLNQLESGHDVPMMERFDMTALLRGVLQKMDIMIQQKNAEVIFEVEEPEYVWADEFKVEEVVTNYVSNALNHLQGENKIEIRMIRLKDRLKISVFNTGTPIPEEDLPNLWSKFYKVDKARTREYGGSGIGLSIVKAIMEGMNQEYGVKNYDNGVAFWFTLDQKS